MQASQRKVHTYTQIKDNKGITSADPTLPDLLVSLLLWQASAVCAWARS